jgi:ketosteroid isomerase-like protein
VRALSYSFACAALLAGCRPQEPAPTTFTAVHAAAISDSVTAVLEQFREAFSARDFDRVLQFYADDPRFRWIEDGEVRYTSKAQLATVLAALGTSLRSVELSFFDPVVTPLGPGIAAVTTRFAQKITDSSGATQGFAGAMLMNLIHADSGWRFLVGQTSLVIPRPGAERK